MLIQYPISLFQWLIWSSLQQYLNTHVFIFTVPCEVGRRYCPHFVAGMRLNPPPRLVRRCVRDVGHRNKVFPAPGQCLSQWLSHPFCRNMKPYPGPAAQTLLVCSKKLLHIPPLELCSTCPVVSPRSCVPLSLASLTPQSIACTFPSTDLFLSQECHQLIKTQSTHCVSTMLVISIPKSHLM